MGAGEPFAQGTFLNKHFRGCVCGLEGGSGAGQRREGTGERRDQHTPLRDRKLILKRQEVSYLNGHRAILL